MTAPLTRVQELEMSDLSPEAVEDLKGLLEKATPRPWVRSDHRPSGLIANVPFDSNRDLIVAAVNALPALLASHAHVQDLEAERDALRARLVDCHTEDASYRARVRAEGDASRAQAAQAALQEREQYLVDRANRAEALLQRARRALEHLLHHEIAHVGPFAGQATIAARATLDAIGREDGNDPDI